MHFALLQQSWSQCWALGDGSDGSPAGFGVSFVSSPLETMNRNSVGDPWVPPLVTSVGTGSSVPVAPSRAYPCLSRGMKARDRERPKQSWDSEKKPGKMVAKGAGPLEDISWGCCQLWTSRRRWSTWWDYRCSTDVPLNLNPLRFAHPPPSGDAHAEEEDTWSSWRTDVKRALAPLSHQGRNLSQQGKSGGRMFYLGAKRMIHTKQSSVTGMV